MTAGGGQQGANLKATALPLVDRSTAQRRAEKKIGMAAAAAWRESRRCPHCRALAYTPCAHRPEGLV